MNLSTIQKGEQVVFPSFIGERVYMREFTKRDGLPADLLRWQGAVDAMLDGIEADGPIYLMVDQGFVNAGNVHRRGGLHVDGRWLAETVEHGGPHHGHRFDGNAELIIFASDVAGCRAWVGEYDGAPAKGGDCSHVSVGGMVAVDMEPSVAWIGNALTTIHESIPVRYDCLRTMVRLNVPMA